MSAPASGASVPGASVPGAGRGRRDAAPVPRHLYIHVPFCAARCDYCEFYSVPVGRAGESGVELETGAAQGSGATSGSGDAPGSEAAVAGTPAERERLLDRFVAALGEEWRRERERFDVQSLETVFIGGGTPSLLGWERLERLLEPFEALLTPRAEITVETNPDDVTPAFAAWAAARRLRISLGVQSFDASLRAALGRRATTDPEEAFATLRRAGVGAALTPARPVAATAAQPSATPTAAGPTAAEPTAAAPTAAEPTAVAPAAAPVARTPGRPGAPGLGIDLIFGLPGQGLADIEGELVTVARLRPDHVSWYELGIVPGSALAARVEPGDGAQLGGEAAALSDGARFGREAAILSGEGLRSSSETSMLSAEATRFRHESGAQSAAADARSDREASTLPDDDTMAAMYRRAVAGLVGLGLDWYEVSNFARPGYRCCHNSAVWRGCDYLGLGPGAVGTVGGRRQRDLPDFEAYLAALEGGADPPRSQEALDDATRARERLLLAARTGERVPLDELGGVIDQSALAPLAAAGLVSLAGGTLRVTRKGRYVANGVCVRLFRDSSFLEA
jgi:coproporphyrinogen III oxidase-like Fe-S oxidoreductase